MSIPYIGAIYLLSERGKQALKRGVLIGGFWGGYYNFDKVEGNIALILNY